MVLFLADGLPTPIIYPLTFLLLPPVSWCRLMLLRPPAAAIPPVVSLVLLKLNPAASERYNNKKSAHKSA